MPLATVTMLKASVMVAMDGDREHTNTVSESVIGAVD
jgi:hypothetical protein